MELTLKKETVTALDNELLEQVFGASFTCQTDTVDTNGCCPETTNSCSC